MIKNQMSRRNFLATTGAIAGTALFNPLSDMKVAAMETRTQIGKNCVLLLLEREAEEPLCGGEIFKKLF